MSVMDKKILLLIMGAFARPPSRNSLSVYDVLHQRPLSTIFVYDSLCSRVALPTNLRRVYVNPVQWVSVSYLCRIKNVWIPVLDVICER